MKKINKAKNCKLLIIILIFIIFSFSPSFANTFQMEWNQISIPPETWVQINMTNTYVNPIVVATPQYKITLQDYGIGVWVTNVTKNSFLIRTSNQNFNSTTRIDINYIIMEKGNWTLPNSTIKVQAGKLLTNKVGSVGVGNWQCPANGVIVNFTNSFISNPLVLSTRGSNNNPNSWAVTFQDNPIDATTPVPKNQMCIGLSQSKAPSPGAIIKNETIYWIASDSGNGILGNIQYQILWQLQDTGISGTNWINGYKDGIPFVQNWYYPWNGKPKVIVASQTSVAGSDGSWPIIFDTGNITALRMFVDEANERSHLGSESGGAWAFNSSGSYNGNPPIILNPKFNETIINQNQTIKFNVTVTDMQGNQTVKNVSATFLFPDNSTLNYSLTQKSLNESINSGNMVKTLTTKKAQTLISNWLIGWTYRKQEIITQPTSKILYNYSIKLDIYNKTGIDNSNNIYISNLSNSNFSDLRFTNSLGNKSGLLSYWIEKNYSNHIVVWIKINKILKNPQNTTIYIYYGNSIANSLSNHKKTFIYYENFQNFTSTPDGKIPAGWNEYGLGNISLKTIGSNRVMLKTSNNDPNGGYINFGKNLSSFESTFYTDRINNNGGTQNRYSFGNSTDSGYGPRMYSFSGTAQSFVIEKRSSGTSISNLVTSSVITNQNVWYKILFSYYNNSITFKLFNLAGGLIKSVNALDSSYKNFNSFFIQGGYNFYTDNITIRNYITPEPNITQNLNSQKYGNNIEATTNYTIYNPLNSNFINNITSLNLTINITKYDNLGSIANSNLNPNLKLGFYINSSTYFYIPNLNITSIGNYNLKITNPNVLKSFENPINRKIKIEGINFDYSSPSKIDEISWNYINLKINYNKKISAWEMIFNNTSKSGIYNITDIYAFDNTNNENHTKYYNLSFNVTQVPTINLISPLNNSKYLSNRLINFSWSLNGVNSTYNCTLYLNNIVNKTISCNINKNISISLILEKSKYNWTIGVETPKGIKINSTIRTIKILDSYWIKISKKIKNVNYNLYKNDIEIINKNLDNVTLNPLDYVQTKITSGSFTPAYLLSNPILGTYYNGVQITWNLSINKNQTKQLKYYMSKNSNLASFEKQFIIGLN